MKKGLTELIFILDKSGSMGGLEADTIGGYNSVLSKQQALEGECIITTVLFDNQYELLHDRIDIQAIRPLSEKEYFVGGSTALLDAIGRTIRKISNVQRNTAEAYRPEKVMFVIITDGEENSSREYSVEAIKKLVEEHIESYGWEFIFLGANIDAIRTAGNFGIAPDRATDYVSDSIGTRLSYAAMKEAVTSFRKTGRVKSSCFQAVREDKIQRGGHDSC